MVQSVVKKLGRKLIAVLIVEVMLIDLTSFVFALVKNKTALDYVKSNVKGRNSNAIKFNMKELKVILSDRKEKFFFLNSLIVQEKLDVLIF